MHWDGEDAFIVKDPPLTHQSAKQPINNLGGSYSVHSSAAVIIKCKITVPSRQIPISRLGRQNKHRKRTKQYKRWIRQPNSLLSPRCLRNKHTRSSQSEQFPSSNFQKLKGLEAF